MKYRPLGRTGLKPSILGLGGFHLLDIDPESVGAIVTRFLDAGGNYIETAAGYGGGESERKLGPLMAERRADCILATKTDCRDRKRAAEQFDRSLRLLQTEHVDIMFMHHIQTPDELARILAPDGALRAAEKARDAGQVSFIGITNHGHPQIMIEALKAYPFDVIMTNFNYYDRFNFPLIEAELIPMAKERGVGLIGMKAIADGLLWRSAEAAFRYSWSLPIDVMVAGMNTMPILEQDLAWAGDFVPMRDSEKERLYAEAPELGTYVCRLCDKCLPCPEGIKIPLIFKLEGWYDRQMWDGVVRDPGDYWMRQALRFWFENQDRAREAYDAVEVQASACTDCGDCEPRCPYNLSIVAKLRSAHYKLTAEPAIMGR